MKQEAKKDPIGEQLQKVRKMRKVSVPKLAAAIGIPKDRIYKWEQGTAAPKFEDRQIIANWIKNGSWNNVPRETMAEESEAEHFIFSKYMRPGAMQKHPGVVSKLWNKHAKKLLGIKGDFYSLKHSNTSETVDALNDQDAAAMNAHTSTAMVVNIYDVKRESRQHERLKKVNNKF